MPHQAVITGVAGPGRAVVGAPISNLTEMHIIFNDKRLQFHYDFAPNFTSEIELANNTSIVITNNGGNFTVTVT